MVSCTCFSQKTHAHPNKKTKATMELSPGLTFDFLARVEGENNFAGDSLVGAVSRVRAVEVDFKLLQAHLGGAGEFLLSDAASR